MRLHLLQHGTHVPDNKIIEEWAQDMDVICSRTVLVNHEQLPRLDDFDWLIVLGGLMDVHEEEKYPWLLEEKQFIKKAIDSKKIILGICLGAQLVAESLGANVYKNEYNEVGWQPISLTAEAKKSPVFSSFPESFSAFQWHYYTFTLPPAAVRIATNEACVNQAFEYDGRVIGVQFHPEFNNDCIRTLAQDYGSTVNEGKFVQPMEEILVEHCLIREIDALLDLLLTNINDTFGGDSE